MPSISYSAGLPFTCRSCSGNILHHWWCDWPHYNVCRSKCPVKDILNRKLNHSLSSDWISDHGYWSYMLCALSSNECSCLN